MSEKKEEKTEIRKVDADALAKEFPKKWYEMVQIRTDGSLVMNKDTAKKAWDAYYVEMWKEKIATVGLIGNRQAMNQKFALYKLFIEGKSRKQSDFIDLAKSVGYNTETALEMFVDFQNMWKDKFVAYVIDVIQNGKKKEIVDDDVLVF